MITQEYLKKVLHYNASTGVFTWRIPLSRRVRVGEKAGTRFYPSKGRNVYMRVQIDKKFYRLHQLAFLWMEGFIPRIIDHKDGDGCNNAWSNLRGCTNTQNLHNARRAQNNTSGVKGVYWNSRERKWYARVSSNGVRYHCGCFTDIESAKLAVENKRQSLHVGFTNHG